MLNPELRRDEAILVLNPEVPLRTADFVSLAGPVNAYLQQQGKVRGVLIRAKAFPAWRDFGALVVHLKFVRSHQQGIEKVAVVADGTFVNIIPSIASHFVRAQVQHFDFAREDAAWTWLRQRNNTPAHAAT